MSTTNANKHLDNFTIIHSKVRTIFIYADGDFIAQNLRAYFHQKSRVPGA